MKFKMNLLVAAVALVAATGANATLKFSNATSNGSSSLSFVAMSADNSTSLVVDLGFQLTDLVSGALAGGTSHTATWNLSTGAVTLDGTTRAGTYAYANSASFLTTNAGAFTWGVIGADSVGGAASGTNLVASQNIVFTGATPDFDNSEANGLINGTVADGAANVTALYAANNTVSGSTHTAGKFGSSVATSGAAFLGTTMAPDGLGNFGGQSGNNNFLVAISDTANVMRAQLNNTGLTVVSQLGATESIGSALDASAAATFKFDEATQTLTYQVSAVPEPQTYAMLIAGLAAVGFVARRRSSR